MDSQRHLRVFDLHSWIGIALGLFVFVVSFTGAVALFADELKTWEDPARRLGVPMESVSIQPYLERFIAEKTSRGEVITFLGVWAPSRVEPYYHASLNVRASNGELVINERRWNAQSASELAPRGGGLSEWLLDFHRDLMWPKVLGGRQIGRFLVGLAGVVLLLSIVSGVVVHSKLLRELFTLRYTRQVRLIWQDTHKVLGLWGLPFYVMIAFTGAFLGVITLVLPIMAFMVVKGDSDKLIDTMGFGQAAPSVIEAPMISVDEMLARVDPATGYKPEAVFAVNWGRENATYDLQYPADTELMSAEPQRVNAVTGERVAALAVDDRSAAYRTFNAIAPLHYATYGGISLKFLYLVAGLSLALMAALGNVMWIERRLHGSEGARSVAFYRRLSALNVGVTLGVGAATVAIFYLDKLYFGPEDLRLRMTGLCYFAVWAAVILYAFARPCAYRATRELLAVIGTGLLGLPWLNALSTGVGVGSLLDSGHALTNATQASPSRSPPVARVSLDKRKGA
ncbi:MAG: PepSY-associated TM helix domain-containing protein, partial [Pseudomonadota bacterium]